MLHDDGSDSNAFNVQTLEHIRHIHAHWDLLLSFGECCVLRHSTQVVVSVISRHTGIVLFFSKNQYCTHDTHRTLGILIAPMSNAHWWCCWYCWHSARRCHWRIYRKWIRAKIIFMTLTMEIKIQHIFSWIYYNIIHERIPCSFAPFVVHPICACMSGLWAYTFPWHINYTVTQTHNAFDSTHTAITLAFRFQ